MFTITLAAAALLLATLALQRWRRAHAYQSQNAVLDAHLDSMLADFDRFEKSMASESRRHRRLNRQLAKPSTPATSESSDPNPLRKRGTPKNTLASTIATPPTAILSAATRTPSTRLPFENFRKVAFPAILPIALHRAINQTHRCIMLIARPLAAIPTLAVRLFRAFFTPRHSAPPSPSA